MLVDSDFVRAILADPEDPGPRLVYSDWLEENGDPARAGTARLEVFQLSEVATGDEGVRALANSPSLAGLDRLKLAGDRPGGGVV